MDAILSAILIALTVVVLVALLLLLVRHLRLLWQKHVRQQIFAARKVEEMLEQNLRNSLVSANAAVPLAKHGPSSFRIDDSSVTAAELPPRAPAESSSVPAVEMSSIAPERFSEASDAQNVEQKG